MFPGRNPRVSFTKLGRLAKLILDQAAPQHARGFRRRVCGRLPIGWVSDLV